MEPRVSGIYDSLSINIPESRKIECILGLVFFYWLRDV